MHPLLIASLCYRIALILMFFSIRAQNSLLIVYFLLLLIDFWIILYGVAVIAAITFEWILPTYYNKFNTMRLHFSTQKLAAGVILEYADLLAGKNLKPLIEQAYGPQGKFIHI
jgi:hypothetical protein